jgi:thioredoxin reductase (NADPH)
MTEIDEDEQFYRDTESIAHPKLNDSQLAMLEPLGSPTRRAGGVRIA